MRKIPLAQEKIKKYGTRFDQKVAPNIQAGPVETRSWTDIWCMIPFIVAVISFIVISAVLINMGKDNYQTLYGDSFTTSQVSQGIAKIMSRNLGVVFGMVILSFGLSIIYILLCAKCAKVVIVFCIVFTFFCYVLLGIGAIIAKVYYVLVIIAIIALINVCVLYCLWSYIETGILLLEASGAFILQKKTVGLIGLITFFLNACFLVLFCFAIIFGGLHSDPDINKTQTRQRQTAQNLLIAEYIIGIYVAYFLYYLMIYALSSAVAFWYYGQQKNVLFGYLQVGRQIGSVALASLIITIIKILRILTEISVDSQNICVQLIGCIGKCIIRCLEGFIEVLNHNSIIVMSISGQNYFDSARTAIGLLFNNYLLFWTVQFISSFIQFYSTIFCILGPSIIAGFIVLSNTKGSSNIYQALLVTLLTLCLTFIVSGTILGILSEVLSSIFIIFCIDKNLKQKGYGNRNAPEQIQKIFTKLTQSDDFFNKQFKLNNKINHKQIKLNNKINHKQIKLNNKINHKQIKLNNKINPNKQYEIAFPQTNKNSIVSQSRGEMNNRNDHSNVAVTENRIGAQNI